MNMFYFIIIIYAVIAVSAHKIPHRVCQDGRNTLRIHLPNIMVWQEHLQNFVHILETCSEMLKSLTWNNNTLRVAVLETEPYVRFQKDSDKIEGFVGDLWSIMTEIFNFKYIVIPINNFNGIRLTENGKADMFFGSTIPLENIDNAAFSQPYIDNWYYLYIKSPNLAINSSFYLKAFSVKFWTVAIFCFMMLTGVIWTTGRILNKMDPNEPNVSIPSCFLASVSGLINQGFDLNFRSYSARTTILFSMLLGTVLYSAMTGVLYSKMTVRDFSLPVNNLEEIPEKDYHLCMRNSSFAFDYFLDANLEILPKWKKSINGPRCLDINDQDNINRIICKRKVVILENNFMMSAFLKQQNNLTCKVIHLKQKYFVKGNVYYIAKHMKHFRGIQRVLMKMKTSGVLQRLEIKYRTKHTDQDFDSGWHTVTLNHIKGVIIWYAGMILLSVGILGIEILCEKRTYYTTYPWNN